MIHVMTCFWNAEDYVEDCVRSILSQSNGDYVVHLVDDMSSDNGYEKCRALIGEDKRFRLVRNEIKKYKLKSMDDLISDRGIMDDQDVVVELDGDDRFSGSDVLSRVGEVYRDSRILICNARYELPDGGLGHSKRVNVSSLRYSPFDFSHLRSWRAGLWRKVDRRYFVNPSDGKYFKTAADVAYSLPMLEASGQDGYLHLEEVMVTYNSQNPRNSHKPDSAVGGISVQNSCAIAARLMDFSDNPYFDRTKIEDYIRNEPRFKT